MVSEADIRAMEAYSVSPNQVVTGLWDDLPEAAKEVWRRIVAKADEEVPARVWTRVREALPMCDLRPGSFGVPVSIMPPVDGESEVYYGCRVTDKPGFYLYGAEIKDVTNWKYRRSPPKNSTH